MAEPSLDHELHDLVPTGIARHNTTPDCTKENQALSDSTPLTAHEQNLNVIIKQIPKFMIAAKRKARRARLRRKRARRITYKKIVAAILFISGVLGTVYGIYSGYHWSGPANDLSKEALDATDLGNWYTYIWTGCPALEAQNISTLECTKARNQAVPAPKKPSSLEAGNPSQVVARHLIPLINGSRELEPLFYETDRYCYSGSSYFSEIPGDACSMLNVSLTSQLKNSYRNPLLTIQARNSQQNSDVVPLPPSLGSRQSPSFVYWVNINLRILSVAYIIYTFLSYQIHQTQNGFVSGIFRLSTLKFEGLRKLDELVEVPIIGPFSLIYWPLGCLILEGPLLVGAMFAIWDLAKWLARDAFLELCLASKNSPISPSLTCQRILAITSHLPIEEEVMVWSLWRAYLFTEIHKASQSQVVINFLQFNILVGMVFLFWYLRCRFVDEGMEELDDDDGEDGDDGVELDSKV